ncbi:MAG: hypothetical protein ACLFWI_04130 [Coleofasciculus sp.]|uniref:hypothetical protein n=1 Tax=Coleofasciculus sp. TaxID=3100458 RepID=UPI003A38E370
MFNQAFTSTALENKINTLPVSVVHLATHGQFSSNPEDTFILTWDKHPLFCLAIGYKSFVICHLSFVICDN